MDWQTMVRDIQEDAGKGSDSSTGTSDLIKRHIIDAIAAQRHLRLWFTEASFSVTTVAGQAAYGHGVSANHLPVDCLSIHGDRLDIDIAGLSTQREHLAWVPIEKMRDMRRRDGYTATPDVYTYYGQKLELYPTPDTSTHIIRGLCVLDVGTLKRRYTGAAWAFYLNDGVTPITSTYTSPWFDYERGYYIVRHYALYLLYSGVWQGASGQADRAIQKYGEYLANARELSVAKTSPRSIEAWSGVED